MAKNYKEKTANYQTISALYHELKQSIGVGKTYDTTRVGAEHLPLTCAAPRPETLPHLTTRSLNFPELNAVSKTPRRGRYPADQHTIEQLHPFQRSGSTRGATSSEIALAARNVMPPPARISATETIHRLNTSTPAQRVSMNHNSTSRALQETGYRPSYVQHLGKHSVDRHVTDQPKSQQESLYQALGGAASGNIHARMSGERGLY